MQKGGDLLRGKGHKVGMGGGDGERAKKEHAV